MADVAVAVLTYNGLPWVERALESVRGHETVVVDHGSTAGTLELVRERFPEVRVVEQENLGFGGGNNRGIRETTAPLVCLLNSDAWFLGDGLERLAGYAEEHPEAAVVGPRLRNQDGSLQRSVRGFPTLWGLATEYLFLRKLAPGSALLNPLYAGGFDHETAREADYLYGACLLVRREAVEQVGGLDEEFFMFSEEVDWMYRFRAAGWKVLFAPVADVVHVGGASHGGRLYRENVRGHLRFLAKHRGVAYAERARRLLRAALVLRGAVFRGERGRQYRDAARWLGSGSVPELLAK
jgi:N-acetylglucosaminyl-diphospho-decaprenol L-rhamnosyltransferase